MILDCRVGDSGEILQIEPNRRLVIRWRNEFKPELHREGDSRMTLELEEQRDTVKLTLIHQMDRPHSKLMAGVSTGWRVILSSLKSLLENGEPLEQTGHWPKGA